ncbi:MAG: hypothetical protein E6K18_07640 [Methanobacteriota archaeon]|nr:MAG: hypothetical protein E6K18_07640 [Euryarchaeota archaeon]
MAVEADTSLAGVDALLLNHYVEQEHNFATTSGDYERPFILASGTAWQLRSPIDGRVLANFTRSGDSVIANGTVHGPGASWTFHLEYDATTPRGPVHVTEDLSFTNEGTVETRIVPVAPCA